MSQDISAPGGVGTGLAVQAVHAALFLLQLESRDRALKWGNKVQQLYSSSKLTRSLQVDSARHSVENYDPWTEGNSDNLVEDCCEVNS